MNKFTDAELKRLKGDLKTGHPYQEWCLPIYRLEAILARMEAAEECVGLLKVHYEAGTFAGADELDDTLARGALRDWEKSCGREAR